MNIVEILTNLFSFENNSEAVVFYSIIFLALLLGMFFAYLLVTRPILRKKRKQISGLQSDLEMANSKIKLTEEKYTVQLSKIKRHEEEATKMQVLIDELQTKSSNYQNEIGQACPYIFTLHLQIHRHPFARLFPVFQSLRKLLLFVFFK